MFFWWARFGTSGHFNLASIPMLGTSNLLSTKTVDVHGYGHLSTLTNNQTGWQNVSVLFEGTLFGGWIKGKTKGTPPFWGAPENKHGQRSIRLAKRQALATFPVGLPLKQTNRVPALLLIRIWGFAVVVSIAYISGSLTQSIPKYTLTLKLPLENIGFERLCLAPS